MQKNGLGSKSLHAYCVITCNTLSGCDQWRAIFHCRPNVHNFMEVFQQSAYSSITRFRQELKIPLDNLMSKLFEENRNQTKLVGRWIITILYDIVYEVDTFETTTLKLRQMNKEADNLIPYTFLYHCLKNRIKVKYNFGELLDCTMPEISEYFEQKAAELKDKRSFIAWAKSMLS